MEEHSERRIAMTKRLKVISSIMAVFLILTTLTLVASASWYGSTMNWSANLNSEFRTKTRYFDGNHIGWEATCSTADGSNGYYKISLYRQGALFDKKVSSTGWLPTNGFGKHDFWNSGGPGNYYFVLERNGYKTRITSNDVKMFSWD